MKSKQLFAFTLILLALSSCNFLTSGNASKKPIDLDKRNALVQKHGLINFANLDRPVFLTIDEFFDGNNDEASIAPNLTEKPPIEEYYRVLKILSEKPKVDGAFLEVKDINVYEGSKLSDTEWLFSDIVYIVGDLSKEEIKEATKSLLPDEVEYDQDGRVNQIGKGFEGKKVVYLWWDQK